MTQLEQMVRQHLVAVGVDPTDPEQLRLVSAGLRLAVMTTHDLRQQWGTAATESIGLTISALVVEIERIAEQP